MAVLSSRDNDYGPNPEQLQVSTVNNIQDTIIDIWLGRFAGRKRQLQHWKARGYGAPAIDATTDAFWEATTVSDYIVQRLPCGEGDTIDNVKAHILRDGANTVSLNVYKINASGVRSSLGSLAGGTQGSWAEVTVTVGAALGASEAAYLQVDFNNVGDGYSGGVVEYTRN